jgi:hypothetical protein
MNAGDIRSKLTGGGRRADLLAKSTAPIEDRIKELYMHTFSRHPRSTELQTATEFLTAPQTDAAGNPIDPARAQQEAFQDLIWALLNTREFQFNH